MLGMVSAGTPVLAEEEDAAAQKAHPKDLVLKGDANCTDCHDESDSPQ